MQSLTILSLLSASIPFISASPHAHQALQARAVSPVCPGRNNTSYNSFRTNRKFKVNCGWARDGSVTVGDVGTWYPKDAGLCFGSCTNEGEPYDNCIEAVYNTATGACQLYYAENGVSTGKYIADSRLINAKLITPPAPARVATPSYAVTGAITVPGLLATAPVQIAMPAASATAVAFAGVGTGNGLCGTGNGVSKFTDDWTGRQYNLLCGFSVRQRIEQGEPSVFTDEVQPTFEMCIRACGWAQGEGRGECQAVVWDKSDKSCYYLAWIGGDLNYGPQLTQDSDTYFAWQPKNLPKALIYPSTVTQTSVQTSFAGASTVPVSASGTVVASGTTGTLVSGSAVQKGEETLAVHILIRWR